MNHLISAGIIVYQLNNNQIEYLLLHYTAGHWDFAKGKVEKGETHEQAALRELQEEAGISATIIPDFKEHFSYFFHDNYNTAHLQLGSATSLTQKTVYFFVGEAQSTDIVLSHEHIDYVWLPYEKALEQLTYNNAKIVLTHAHDFITNNS
jgi:bis(5'-nucleosidyl)-tetraphosphatase